MNPKLKRTLLVIFSPLITLVTFIVFCGLLFIGMFLRDTEFYTNVRNKDE